MVGVVQIAVLPFRPWQQVALLSFDLHPFLQMLQVPLHRPPLNQSLASQLVALLSFDRRPFLQMLQVVTPSFGLLPCQP